MQVTQNTAHLQALHSALLQTPFALLGELAPGTGTRRSVILPTALPVG